MRISLKITKQIKDMMINLHMHFSKNKEINITLVRAVDISMSNPNDIMLALLTFAAQISQNLNDIAKLQSYLIEKYNFDLLRPYKEL